MNILNEILKEELIVLILFVFGYLLYYFSPECKLAQSTAKKLDTHIVYLQKILGFIYLGVLPFIITMILYDNVHLMGLSIPQGNNLWLWCGIPIAFFFIGSLFPRENINTDFYPQARIVKWTKKDIMTNSIVWILYLLGYEYMFRGLILFTLIDAYGLVSAIVINSVIYSLVHIYKGKMEAFGAFFLGIVLCIITCYTQSMWVAFVVHVILALANDFHAINYTTH